MCSQGNNMWNIYYIKRQDGWMIEHIMEYDIIWRFTSNIT
jgi:hypothetical protein